MIGRIGAATRLVLLLAFFLALATGLHADATMSAEEFTKSYAARVEKFFPGAKATVKAPLEVHIKMPADKDDGSFRSYLDNAFKSYLDEPASVEEIMDRHIRVLGKDLSRAAVEKREQLVPVVRHRNFMNETQKAKRADQSFPERQIAGDIYVFYAFDAPDTVHYADSTMIKESGVTATELDGVAIENLRRIMSEPLLDTYPEMVVVSSTDPYLTSVLLIDQFWSADRFRFRGELVVFVVARDLMLVTGSEEQGGLETARKAAQGVFGQLPYAISIDPIVRRDGKWQSFVQ